MINKQRLLATFLEYVQIDSESTHEGAMADRLASDLAAVGCEIYRDGSMDRTGCETGNLYCTLPGTAPGEAVVLTAHMDTVVPGVGIEPVVEDGIIRSKGNTVLGSDDKSGAAAIVEAMRTLVEQKLPHPTVQGVFTVGEEIGLKGSAALEYDRLAAGRAVVMDSSGDAGKIILSAPGQYKLSAVIIGRRAHAGVAPEEGVSAIQVAAEAIAHMKLLRIDGETTANIGSICAQSPTNIVPERLELVGEARSRSSAKLEVQAGHMMDCLRAACEKYGARLEGGLEKAYESYAHSPDDPFVQQVAEAWRRAGAEPVLTSSGGGSDANHLNANGVKAVVVGTGMSKVHTVEEEITVQNLERTAALALALMTP